jgi:two-component system cell cycle response regulator DivK
VIDPQAPAIVAAAATSMSARNTPPRRFIRAPLSHLFAPTPRVHLASSEVWNLPSSSMGWPPCPSKSQMAKRTEEYSASERAVAPARILIVEDNSLNRLLIRDILALRGHEVMEAATVDEARAALAANTPDLLLLDVQIPGGGGEAVIREVRARADLADLPIIAVTSLAMPGDRERLLSIGFQGYLSKPIDTRTFAAAIETYLKPGDDERQVQHVRNLG